MKLNNPFSQDTRNIFLYIYACFDCGRSDRGLSLHHIKGRISNSPINAIPLCLDCHSKVGHTQDEEQRYFKLTLQFLVKEKYTYTLDDIVFYQENVLE
jgi:DNA-directed RNA polymerase subunit RPC12/RpoP